MFRLIIGIVLLGLGIYFAWEAHSVVNNGISDLEATFAVDEVLSSSDIDTIHSPTAEFAYILGANTIDSLRDYLLGMQVAFSLIAVTGGYLVFSRLWKFA